MFVLRQCRLMIPVLKMRHISNRTAFAIPSSSNIVAKRFSRATVPGPVKPPDKLTFKEVEGRVLKAIRAWDRFPQDKSDALSMDSRFIEDLSLDSLDLIEVTMVLEDEFELEIPETNVDKFKTPRDVFKYVCEKENVFD